MSVAAAAIGLGLSSVVNAGEDDIARMCDNITKLAFVSLEKIQDIEPADDSESDIQQWIETQTEYGSWNDIDYTDQSRAVWKAFMHVHRTKIIAVRGIKSNDAKACNVAVRALEYWLSQKRTNPNWWWDRIGTPRNVGFITILMRDKLPDETVDRAIDVLGIVDKTCYTAMNRVWEADVMLCRGLLSGDETLVKTARDIMVEEVRISGSEGIMPDWSFHQHGNQLYTGGYGLTYLYVMSRMIGIFTGTKYAFPPEKIKIIEDYLENAYPPSMIDDRMDFALVPRGIFPHDQRVFGKMILDAAAMIGEDGTDNGKRVSAIFAKKAYPEGFHWFPYSAYSTYRGKGWLMSHRGGTKSIIGAETWINDDNPLGQHLADGTLMTYVTGHEYEDVSPLWNWRRLPGITSYADIGPDMRFAKRSGTANELEDYHATATGNVATVTFAVSREGLSYRQRIEFSPKGATAETYDIRSTNPALRVATCVESAHACSNAGIVSQTAAETRVQNGSIIYVIEAPKEAVSVTIEDRAGDFRSVKSSMPPTPCKGRVLEICVDHGKAPNGARARYRIIPAE